MADEKKKQGTTRVTQILLLVTMLGLMVFVGSIGLTAWLFTRSPKGAVAEGSFLLVELKGMVPDAPGQGGMMLDPSDFPVIVTEISAALRKAAADERIEGVYLAFDSPQMGGASAQEIRDALVEFTATGKPCVAYSELYTTGTYFIASACDRVVLAPSGLALVSGMNISVSYFAETFEKLGIEPEFEHVGDFKSAVEPYERTGPSEPAAAAYEALLDSMYGQLVKGIASGRKLEEAQVRALIDDLQLSPKAALDRGLVDALAFPDAITATLPNLKDADWPTKVTDVHPALSRKELDKRITALPEYVKDLRAANSRAKKKIAVIHAEGPIQSGSGESGLFGGQTLTDGAFKGWMRAARERDDVVAVVIRVNSPGGSGLASDMMWHEVRRMKAAGKPVVVSMGDYAASGGYYISANADWIVAQPNTITGSIGVLGGKFNLAGTFDKIGLHTHSFKRGELADLLATDKAFSASGREAFKTYLHDFYDVFLDRVTEGRKMDRDAVHAVAQGRVWTGEQAIEHKLVDELGGLDRALAKAAELGGVEDYGLARWPQQKTFFELLMEDFAKTTAPTLRVEVDVLSAPGVSEALEEALRINAMASGNGVLTYLPLRVELP